MLDELIKLGKIKHYKKNDVIFNEDEYCRDVGLIISGEMKIVTYTSDGKENIINDLKMNDFFGDLLVFSTNPYYYGMGIALSNCDICFINKDLLFDAFNKNSSFLSFYLRVISDKSIKLKQINKLYAHKNIEERLKFYLKTKQKETNSNIIFIKSVTSLSQTLGIPRPSLSRCIHKLVKTGEITIKDKKIILSF